MRGFSFHLSTPLALGPLLAVALLCLSCDSQTKTNPTADPKEDKRPLLEPEEVRTNVPTRCRPLSGGQPVAIRAQPGGSKAGTPSAVEVGNSAAVEGGYATGVLRTGAHTEALVHFTDGRGTEKLVDLGRVHGSVDPPRVLGRGPDVIVAVSDNDAGHSRIRLAKITQLSTQAGVTWGPEIQVRRGETAAFSLSALSPMKKANKDAEPPTTLAVLAWDDYDKSRLSSRIRALTFDPATMKSLGGERFLSPVQDDAVTPVVVPRRGGFWVVWIAYGELSSPEGNSNLVDGEGDLVAEPPALLRVQKLDERAEPLGEPLTISEPGEQVLVHEASVYGPDGLAVVFRRAASGRPVDATPIATRIVRADGSVSAGSASHAVLGPGAPALLEAETGAWLSARGQDTEVLLGQLDDSANCSDLEVEPGLSGQIPLLRTRDEILTMRPDGLDLKLSVVVCQLPAPQ